MLTPALERLHALKPWDNVNEEDLYRVDGLLLSIRGNTHLPAGVWCTSDRALAERWIANPDDGPEDAWVYDVDQNKVTSGSVGESRAEAALARVLDQFEGKPCDGVEFPIFLNPKSRDGESLPRG